LLPFAELVGSLPFSQEPTNAQQSESGESIPQHLTLFLRPTVMYPPIYAQVFQAVSSSGFSYVYADKEVPKKTINRLAIKFRDKGSACVCP
jgi:hypothetical protein